MSSQVYPTLPGAAFPTTRRALHKNIVLTAASGKEVRIAMWSFPKWEWDIPYNYLKTDVAIAHFQTLVGFFNQMHGDFDTFLYRDLYDFGVSAQSIATGNGTKVAFQIVRTFGGFTEPIFDVDATHDETLTAGVPKVYLNGVLKTVTTDYTIGSTGILTFTSAPGAGVLITATFAYYFRVRFKESSQEYQEFITNVYECKRVSLITANA